MKAVKVWDVKFALSMQHALVGIELLLIQNFGEAVRVFKLWLNAQDLNHVLEVISFIWQEPVQKDIKESFVPSVMQVTPKSQILNVGNAQVKEETLPKSFCLA